MPVLGMRGTGSFSSDERPKNYREQILLLQPNAKQKASLTSLLAMMKMEPTNDPEFKIFTKGLPSQRVLVSGSHTSGVTSIALQGTTPAKVLKKGHALINERTLEVLWVTADPSGAFAAITVARGKGSTAASMNDGDGLMVVGNHNQEGADVPTAISYDPSVTTNYIQTHRTSLDITNDARATKLRTGPALLELQRETLEIHGIERENTYVFGTGVEDTSGAQPERTTKGHIAMVTTNVKDFADAVDIDSWEQFLEDCFEDGSNEKMLLAGNAAITVINKVARLHGEINMLPTSETYGMDLSRYRTPYGYLIIGQEALFSKNPTFKDWGIVLDPAYMVDRILQGNGVDGDTDYFPNRQANGADKTTDEWITRSGFELQHETVFGVAKNMSAFIP